MPQKKDWSNDLPPEIEPTPREVAVKELAEAAKDVKPQTYNITSRNKGAMRVVHDFHGEKVSIPPGETVQNIELRPDIAEYLGKGDLILTAV